MLGLAVPYIFSGGGIWIFAESCHCVLEYFEPHIVFGYYINWFESFLKWPVLVCDETVIVSQFAVPSSWPNQSNPVTTYLTANSKVPRHQAFSCCRGRGVY
jgi:hypothetical protein